MPRILTSDEIKRFHEVGYLEAGGFFCSREVRDMRDAFDRIQNTALSGTGEFMDNGSKFYVKSIEDGGKRIEHVNWCGAAEPILMKYSRDRKIRWLALDLLGSEEANHLVNQVHFKLPGDGMEFPFHQDCMNRRYETKFWKDVNGKGSYVNAIIAIDPMAYDNGPLLVSENPGRHVGKIGFEGQKRHLEIAKPILLNPGDVLALGPYVIHGSLPNESKSPRRVLINGFAYPGANSRKFDIPHAGEMISLA
jgi:ectoine hydroxylase-related dioxygenase (phytanoyl-CoA dioxygenase family)